MKNIGHIIWLAALCVFSQSSAVQSQSCTFVWEEARSRIARECTDRINSNTMCYGYETLVTEPAFADFVLPGQIRPIDRDLVSVETNLDGGLGGFSFLKVIAGRRVDGLPIGQAVIMIAFGDTGLRQIVSRQAPLPDAQPVCTASLRQNSTTFGGSYIRAIPDPNHQMQCASLPCTDKNNLLYFIGEGEELGVLGRNAANSTLLVQNRFATGWMSAAPSLMELNGCTMGNLPVYRDDIVSASLDAAVNLPITSQFVLFNTTTPESQTCNAEGRPPGGLLILNASHQNLVFSVNSIEISIASSVLIMSHSGVTRIFVLQGEARATTTRGSIAATDGETIAVVSNAAPIVLSGSGTKVGWCDSLRRLAAAAYGLDERLPDERLDYCGAASNGYLVLDATLTRLFFSVDQPDDGLSWLENRDGQIE